MTMRALGLTLAMAMAAVVANGCVIDVTDDCGHPGDACLFDSDCSDGLFCGDDETCFDPNPSTTYTVSASGGGSGGSGNGGAGSGAGTSDGGSDAGGAGSGGAGSGGDGGGQPPLDCNAHADCPDGQHCNLGQMVCVDGPMPCLDVAVEQSCVDRTDCEPIYAGVNCSCGANCQCVAGEPGCVCEGFEFFKCEDATPAP